MIRNSCWPLPALRTRDRRFLDVLAGRARLHQHRRRLVDVMGEVEIVEARLALAAAAAVGHGAALLHAPGPREHFDLVLVLGVERFALDVADLRENVCCHNDAPVLRVTITPIDWHRRLEL